MMKMRTYKRKGQMYPGVFRLSNLVLSLYWNPLLLVPFLASQYFCLTFAVLAFRSK